MAQRRDAGGGFFPAPPVELFPWLVALPVVRHSSAHYGHLCRYVTAVKHGEYEAVFKCVHGGFPVNSEEEGVGGTACSVRRSQLRVPDAVLRCSQF